jgi:hypothetical protein
VIHIKTSTLVRITAAVGTSFLLAAPALAEVVVPPPAPAECETYVNHGDYVSCYAHEKEIWNSKGNSEAGISDIGR